MKRYKKMLLALLTVSMLTGLFSMSALAAPADTAPDTYTYKFTLYAGNKGTIAGQNKISYDVNSGGTVTLKVSDVQVTDDKYYVKGFRLSGHDNAEAGGVDSPVITVTEDMDYVVAYGIKGDQVAYTVNYQDANGNELAPSSTFYGNVGDKPVVAYQYVEGYVPEALAMTKTLSENEAENVFTFVYNPGETGRVIYNDTVVTTVVPGAAAPGAGTTGAAGTAGQTGAGAGAGAAGEAEDQNVVENPDEDTPQSLVDLDDEETPKDKVTVHKDAEKGMPLVGMIAIIVAAVAALVILIMALKKRAK